MLVLKNDFFCFGAKKTGIWTLVENRIQLHFYRKKNSISAFLDRFFMFCSQNICIYMLIVYGSKLPWKLLTHLPEVVKRCGFYDNAQEEWYNHDYNWIQHICERDLNRFL